MESLSTTPHIQPKDNLTGVYRILNTVNGKQYVGSTGRSLGGRRRHHWDALRHKKHGNRHLQAAWLKYGEDSFEFHVLFVCPPEWAILFEQFYIWHLNPEYNIAPVAGSSLGREKTPETREKLRRANLGKKQSPEAIAKRVAAVLGRKHSPETIEKMRKAHPGKRPEITRMLLGRKRADNTSGHANIT